ncbi:hypothetical protein CERSUDRAFT_117172 [Gelatoporia subvermispora B]|uniref:F-box domain-containing protein n=1 Tax=Ceriporiopsis subvermispora (strain B) TaxID=914234 RepID=M2PEI6_CERS8|nr:hypothetical protein CERSUDRAFT_117172 [Gelatoporia subvermispora B]
MTQIPVELTLLIFSDLDFRQVLRCRQACKSFRDIVDSDAAIQYKINLALGCMEDNPSNRLGIIKKKNLLRLHQMAWWNLSPAALAPFKGDETTSGPRRWGAYISSTGRGELTHTKVNQLPSQIRRIPGASWYLGDIAEGNSGEIVRLDPAQNLILVFGDAWDELDQNGDVTTWIAVYPISMIDGAAHPAAASPTLPIVVDGTIAHQHIDVFGDYFIFVEILHRTSMELRVFNWKTGNVHLWLRGYGIGECNFISDSHIIISLLGMKNVRWRSTSCLAIAKVDPEQIVTQAMKPKGSSFVCILRYPNSRLSSINLNVLTAGSYAMCEPYKTDVPFRYANEHALVDIRLGISRDLELIHLIPLSILRRIIGDTNGVTRVFQWEDWAMETFLLNLDDYCTDRGLCRTKLLAARGVENGWCLRLYDFNQRLVKLAQSCAPDALKELGAEGEIVQLSSNIPEDVARAFPLPPRFCYMVEKVLGARLFHSTALNHTPHLTLGEDWIEFGALMAEGGIGKFLAVF